MNEKLLEEKVISSTCLARRVKVIRLIDLSEFHMESANVRHSAEYENSIQTKMTEGTEGG